jgi:hypothetical protein
MLIPAAMSSSQDGGHTSTSSGIDSETKEGFLIGEDRTSSS